jgi:hypothetical protein
MDGEKRYCLQELVSNSLKLIARKLAEGADFADYSLSYSTLRPLTD